MNKSLVMAGSILVVIIAFGILSLGLIGSTEREGPLVIYFPVGKDFLNSNEGTATFQFKFPDTGFKVGEETADILMFLDSKQIDGLKILYHQKEMKLSAGIPFLVVENIAILDGQEHKLVYTFDRAQEQQSVSLDGNLLASGAYSGGVTVLTGYVAYEEFNVVESDFPIEVNIE
ncbi:MAG: hypothetical protein IIC69_01395 [Nanoarchaeota archaeon]|nr:hypothetical protein [Nanoarchaeota archaeon]